MLPFRILLFNEKNENHMKSTIVSLALERLLSLRRPMVKTYRVHVNPDHGFCVIELYADLTSINMNLVSMMLTNTEPKAVAAV